MTMTEPVQRAAHIHLGAADLEVRNRARYAPTWMKRRIDAARQERGAVPLWATAKTTRQRVARKVQRLRIFLTMTRATVAAAGS